jgi:hypothetical protein
MQQDTKNNNTLTNLQLLLSHRLLTGTLLESPSKNVRHVSDQNSHKIAKSARTVDNNHSRHIVS